MKTGIHIDINSEYAVTSDERNLILNRKYIVKSGKHAGEEALAPIGFYPSVRALVSGLVNNSVMTSAVTNLEQLADHIERASNECQEAFKGVAA